MSLGPRFDRFVPSLLAGTEDIDVLAEQGKEARKEHKNRPKVAPKDAVYAWLRENPGILSRMVEEALNHFREYASRIGRNGDPTERQALSGNVRLPRGWNQRHQAVLKRVLRKMDTGPFYLTAYFHSDYNSGFFRSSVTVMWIQLTVNVRKARSKRWKTMEGFMKLNAKNYEDYHRKKLAKEL